MNTIFGDRDQATAVLDYIEGLDRPAVEAAVGNGGLVTFVDEDGGIIVAASYWDEPAHASASALTDVRMGAEVISRGMVISDSYEVGATVRRTVAQRGAAVRLDRVQLECIRLDGAVAFLSAELLAELTRCESLCSAEILVDAGSSSALVFTVWDTVQGAEAGCRVIETLRARAADLGAKFVSVERYTLMGVSANFGVSADGWSAGQSSSGAGNAQGVAPSAHSTSC
jgi:hypothetical protein